MIYLRAKFHMPASSGTSLLVKSEFSHRCHVTIIYSPKYYIKKGLHLPTIVISAPQRKWSQCSFRRYQVSRKSVKCSKLKWTHKCMYNNNNNNNNNNNMDEQFKAAWRNAFNGAHGFILVHYFLCLKNYFENCVFNTTSLLWAFTLVKHPPSCRQRAQT